MNKLFFVSCWPDFRTAWSGTPKGLYTALSNRLELHPLNGCRYTGKIGKALNGLSMGLFYQKSSEQFLEDQKIPLGMPVFTFYEYCTKNTKDTYCYQDLSVDYMLRLRKNHHPAAKAYKRIVPTFIIEKKNAQAKRFYQDCAGIFTMSEWLRKDLIEHTGIPASKVHHVGGGSNIDVSKIDDSQKQGNKFLFVGKVWDLKNGDLVVEAFKKLAAAYPERNLQLYIAGPEEKPASTEGQENIIFLGRLSYEELISYYNLCDYFVMPSKHDAYGLVFVEALCFGLPCIGKNICAMPEFIQHDHTGFLLENDDAQELFTLMEKLLLDAKRFVSNVRANRDFYLKEYSWDAVAGRIMEVLKKDGYV